MERNDKEGPPYASSDDCLSWHNGADLEIHAYTRALRYAATVLLVNLDLQPNVRTQWDASPVALIYRQCMELLLKELVSEGGHALPEPVDHITLHKTHSLRWLARIVCRIIKALSWESEFQCEGVTSLAEFSSLIEELEAMEPITSVVHSANRRRDGSVPPQLQPVNVARLSRKLDALLDLLAMTADALAADQSGRSVSRYN